ncbi:MAG: DUF2069 domain-containing protein [Betaproteobacteria bacterium]|nr:DUF2069 domain-containing protein [Betaproteobacteria bacterium]
MLRPIYLLACASLIALIFFCLAWELRIAPLRPGGSMLAFKALPLLLPLFGILHGRRYTYQWASLLILAYLVEGLVRAISEPGVVRLLSLAEIALSLVFFVAAIAYVRLTRNSPDSAKGDTGFS